MTPDNKYRVLWISLRGEFEISKHDTLESAASNALRYKTRSGVSVVDWNGERWTHADCKMIAEGITEADMAETMPPEVDRNNL